MAGADYQGGGDPTRLNMRDGWPNIGSMKKRAATEQSANEAILDWDGSFDLRFGRRPDQVVTIPALPPDSLSASRRKALRRAVIEAVRTDRNEPSSRITKGSGRKTND